MNREKKQEWSTYRRLYLNRQHKSRAKREAIEKKGIYCYIGGTRGRPYIKILKADYNRIFREEEKAIYQSGFYDQVNSQNAVDLMRNHLENKIYDRLLTHMQSLDKIEETTFKNEGRTLSAHEREIYSKALTKEPTVFGYEALATATRKRWVQNVLSSVYKHSRSNPNRLQAIWQDIVGVDNAQQVQLTFVNKQRGIAYCKSINPTATSILRRNKELPEKLGKALGLKITKIVFR